jgi:para-aminobenzoate synthetase/4-amino-4-deoxychorismate lyase
VRLEAHLARLAASARHFGFRDPVEHARRALDALATSADTRRVRIEAAPEGVVQVTDAALAGDASRERTAALARTPVSRDDVFLHHKTTHRAVYELRRAERPGVDDVLLWNAEGELTEFIIGNLVVEIDGARVTPPRASGLLGGVFRAELLARGAITERVLGVDALERATRLWLVNSLREWVPVTLVAAPSE